MISHLSTPDADPDVPWGKASRTREEEWFYMRDMLLEHGTIAPGDLERLFLTDSPEDAVAHVRDTAPRKLGLSYRPRVRRRWFLRE